LKDKQQQALFPAYKTEYNNGRHKNQFKKVFCLQVLSRFVFVQASVKDFLIDGEVKSNLALGPVDMASPLSLQANKLHNPIQSLNFSLLLTPD
jgi:hypothetical protein